MKARIVCLLLLLSIPPSLAENSLDGTLTIAADGSVSFDGHLVRDDVNVSLAALNVARETPIKESQYVHLRLDEALVRRLGQPPRGQPAGDDWILSLHLPHRFEMFQLAVRFPRDVRFAEISSTVPYLQEGDSLVFRARGVDEPAIDVVYSLSPPPGKKPSFAFHTTALLIAGCIAASAVAVFVVRWRRKNGAKALNPDVIDTLTLREERLVRLLFDAGGCLTQTRLRQMSGLPKSTLSNALRGLESRRLVRRFEHGSTLDVELEDRVYTKEG